MTLPNHFMVSECNGHLYDTRKTGWPSAPVRRDYRHTFRTIKTGAELRATLRAGGAAFPGGYTIALFTSDGEMVSIPALCADKHALWTALYDIRTKQHSRIIGADTYDEGPTVQCAYTNTDIESSYGEPEGEE